MKPSSALGALSASNLFLSTVHAAPPQLDVDSPDSIKQAAKLLSINLRSYYTGDRPGDIPGNLPQDPVKYYWWECGAMFGAFIDYWYYTGDTTYNDITRQALQHQIGENDAFEPKNQSNSLGNDDQAFWAMAAMSAAENRFPDLPSGNPSWLALVQAVFNRQAFRWDKETCGGGLQWQIYNFNPGWGYKNTISNGCFFNIAARLYKYLGNDTYAQWAEKTWDWEQSIGFITPDYQFYDGADSKQNCSADSFKKYQWTYNAAVHLAGAAAMWNATNSDVWKRRVQGILNGTNVFFINGVMTESACEDGRTCNTDQKSFKAYLSRWLGYTAKIAPWTRNQIDPLLKSSALAAVKQCNGGPNQTSCGMRWIDNGNNDGTFGVGQQLAAMEIVQNLLYVGVSGPVTQSTGGLSASDPNAGTQNSEPLLNFNSITTGDKAGASILTLVVLSTFLGGAWWMIA